MTHETAGDPMSGLKWTRRTTEKIAAELRSLGIGVGPRTVARLLTQLGFSLRVNQKKRSTGSPSRRNEQFEQIASLRERFVTDAAPIISVDTKKVTGYRGDVSGRETRWWEPVGCGARKEVDEDCGSVQVALLRRAEDTGEDLLGVCAPGGAIATRHLAIDDGRPQGLFGAPVGGVDRGIEEKAEEGGEFDAEMRGEAAHGRQRADVIERRVQPRRDMAAGDRGPVPRDRPGVPPVANAERLLQRGLHPAGKLRAGMILAQVATPSQQMRETGLMRGRGELAIRCPPIAHQHAGVLGPEDAGGLGKASAGLNGIHRRLRRREGPQPVAVAVDPPARFIRRDHGTATNRLAQSDVGWPRLPGRPMQGAGHGARGDRHGEPIAQQRGDFAMRQPELLIELHHQRHGLRAELHTSRP